MLKLKDRKKAVPNGFLYRQGQTGWDNSKVAPYTLWDFYGLCRELQAHRMANPQFGLNTDMRAIESEVDFVTAKRIAAIPGAFDEYLVDEGAGVPPKPSPPLSQKLLAAVGAVKRASKGGAVLLDWEKSGEPPVPSELSEGRAMICSTCPQNGKGDFTRWFTVPASELIRRQLERVKSLDLKTSYDEKLGVCEACLCPLKLKVHTPVRFIVEHMPPDVKADLDPRCWILAETK